MDNQFKNVKTNARLLSKAMWYEWRMKLLDGLKEGLMTIGQGMEEDARSLTQQEQILQPVLPGLMEEHGKLESQIHIAQVQVDELAGCNQEELQEARDDLVSLEQDLEAKRAMVEELQNQLRESEDRLEETLARKQECTDEIKEAEKVRTDCQGWGAAEVLALQSKHIRQPFDSLYSQCRSQSQRTRSLPRLDDHIRQWPSTDHDVQWLAPALLQTLVISP